VLKEEARPELVQLGAIQPAGGIQISAIKPAPKPAPAVKPVEVREEVGSFGD